ncbi:hypothetical protein GF581_10970 [Staphylococcus aureus]|nr:hypothetical protein [Staphylococcus aureus]
MILDNVNPNDLFPTEKKGPSVLGIIEYQVQGENEFEGAFIATNERLIMNVDMNRSLKHIRRCRRRTLKGTR